MIIKKQQKQSALAVPRESFCVNVPRVLWKEAWRRDNSIDVFLHFLNPHKQFHEKQLLKNQNYSVFNRTTERTCRQPTLEVQSRNYTQHLESTGENYPRSLHENWLHRKPDTTLIAN